MDLTVRGRKVGAGTGGRPFDPATPVVVLLHGAGMDRTVWALQARALAAHGRAVLAPDLPGHGASEGPPLASVADLADWTAELVRAAGAERAALVGHSMGAAAALECAARHPDVVRALALVGAAERMPVNPALIAAAEDDVPAAVGMILGFGLGPAAQLASAVPGVWTRGAAARVIERAPPGALAADFRACDAWTTGAESAAAVRCPAVLVLGSLDRMTPAKAGRALAARIPGAEVEEIPGVGHMLMQEAPDAVTAVLLRGV